MSLRGKAAVVGVAESDLGEVGPGFTPLDLIGQATLRALDDAGLDKSEVDGLIGADLNAAQALAVGVGFDVAGHGLHLHFAGELAAQVEVAADGGRADFAAVEREAQIAADAFDVGFARCAGHDHVAADAVDLQRFAGRTEDVDVGGHRVDLEFGQVCTKRGCTSALAPIRKEAFDPGLEQRLLQGNNGSRRTPQELPVSDGALGDQQIVLGRVDAVWEIDTSVADFQLKNPGKYDVAYSIAGEDKYGVYFGKGKTDVGTALTAALKALKDDGTLAGIATKYNLDPVNLKVIQ